MKLVWTERAVADLEAIEDYIAIDNPTAALAMVERLLARAATLVDQPMKGRVVPELMIADIRELVIRNYRLVYRIVGSRIEVLQVFEGHKLFEP